MRRVGLVLGMVGCCVLLFGGVVAALWVHFLKQSAFYAAVLEFARSHPVITEHVGPVTAVSRIPFGFYTDSAEEKQGEGHVMFLIRGERGIGKLHAAAYRNFGHWVVETAELYAERRQILLDTVHLLMEEIDHLSEAELKERVQFAAAIQPHAPEPQYALGEYYLGRERYAPAEDAFRAAIARDGTFAPAYNELGIVLMRRDRIEEALATFQQAADHAPWDPLPLLNQAAIYRDVEAVKDLERSRQLAESARERDANDPRVYDFFADLHQAQGETEAAETARARARDLRETTRHEIQAE
ncbi:MAG: hypothetical protein HY543_05250 [Deltaproteobacteria bacterium]|nr:hypothetical protein [Deltaproteobacteria bacterium]